MDRRSNLEQIADQGMIFFSCMYLTDFSYFSVKRNSENCRIQLEQVKTDLFERGYRWFHLFLIDFQLFYFLSRIIPDWQNIYHLVVCIKQLYWIYQNIRYFNFDLDLYFIYLKLDLIFHVDWIIKTNNWSLPTLHQTNSQV